MGPRPHPEFERSLHGPLQSFDVDAEVTRLRQEKAWQEGRRNAITLRKGEGLNVVLLVMKEGDRLDEHSAPGPITLSVHEGRIRFSAAGEDVEAKAGTMLACDAGVRHSVEALGDAVCLLNVATGSERRGLG
jgi:quercetin dioxygenase-like cupin family protein